MMYSNDFPEHFESGGKKYPIHTDYREWIRFECLISDADVPESLKTVMALRMIFADNIPDDILGAAAFMTWFYRCGKPAPRRADDNNASLETRRVYDFEYDSEYIYAAFLEQYGIDLTKADLHWWKFRALFMGLHDCRFTEIMGYRGAEISDDLPDSRKAFLLDMQEAYALPVSLTEQRCIDAARKFLET